MSATEYMDRPTLPTPPPQDNSGRILLGVALAVLAIILAVGMLAIAIVAFGRSSSDDGSSSGGFEVESTTESAPTDESGEASASPSTPASNADAAPTSQATDQASNQETDGSTEVFSDADDAENSAAAPFPTGLQPLALRGMGSITFGMTVGEAEAALGATMEFGLPASEGCFNGMDPTDVNSPLFMVLTSTGDPADGSVVRIDLDDRHSTRAGIRIGSSKAQVLEAYGDRIVASPHPYDSSPGSEYLTYVPNDQADADYRLIIETQADSVVGIRAGLLPAVEWIEGCA